MYEINIDLLQNILNYLGRQPHDDVRLLIDSIAKCKPIKTNKPVDNVEKKHG